MYRSKEIRWFKSFLDAPIEEWFARHGQHFDQTEARTDFYLPSDREDITIKLREGNVEIKRRLAEPQQGALLSDKEGLFELWEKWSFNAAKEDKLSSLIVEKNPYGWIETVKTRIGVKVQQDSNGSLKILPIKSFVENGCQIEYTLLQIGGKQVYTFALEWFGVPELALSSELINDIVGSVSLNAEDSMGYGAYLKQ